MAYHTQAYARWAKIIGEWRESGLSGAEFCRRHGHRSKRFYKWRQRLEEEEETEGAAGFVAVSFSENSSSHGCGVRVVLNEKVHLELSPGFDADVLRRAVQALGGSC